MAFTRIHSFFNPEHYQGWGKKRQYFEGWYYKVINQKEDKAMAFIPGISMDENGKQQAFIQVLDGIQRTAEFHRFDAQSFKPSKQRFEVQIASNEFSENHLKLDLPDIRGELTLVGNVPWPKPVYSPGIMGPFAFIPFMECYHGVVSMNHNLKGHLTINKEEIDFTGGRGYLEKDWGRSFPSAYTWMQSNHFNEEGISFKASVAKIPFLGSWFVGFISGLWLQDRLIRFTTYNGTKLRKSAIDRDEVELVMENRKHRLEVLAYRDKATALASPILGLMDGRIEESMTSSVKVLLTDKKNKSLLFEGQGRNTALEVAGNIKEIIVS